MKKQAFTLAEVLITLAIIGVVAAISIPSVVANTQQKEFQTGLRKAVSVLNSSITMNMAIDGESPYENKNLYKYLQRHMAVMKSNALNQREAKTSVVNGSFYTTDGMRFEVPEVATTVNVGAKFKLYENPDITLRRGLYSFSGFNLDNGTFTNANDCTKDRCAYCGSYGLNSNTDNTTTPPCIIVVDVNGDRKPFPQNASCYKEACSSKNVRKYGDPSGLHLTDTFSIMITDKQAIPYGQAAQKAMYQAQKTK